MKLTICLCFLFAVAAASGQLFLPTGFIPYPVAYPYNFGPGSDVYGASLGGAKVGIYGKERGLGGLGGFPGPFGFPGLGGFPGPYGGSSSDVTGASLGGAPVGIYGKEH